MNGALVDGRDSGVFLFCFVHPKVMRPGKISVVDIFTEKGRDRHRASGGEILLLLVQRKAPASEVLDQLLSVASRMETE